MAFLGVFETGVFQLILLLRLFREADELCTASSYYLELSVHVAFLG